MVEWPENLAYAKLSMSAETAYLLDSNISRDGSSISFLSTFTA
jgi:hypothetical protein